MPFLNRPEAACSGPRQHYRHMSDKSQKNNEKNFNPKIGKEKTGPSRPGRRAGGFRDSVSLSLDHHEPYHRLSALAQGAEARYRRGILFLCQSWDQV